MMKRPTPVLALALLAALSGCAGFVPQSRPDVSGQALIHFFKVDEGLYRGGQPTDEGFRELKALGVKTVVSLRAYGHTARREAAERKLVESLGMRWVSLPMRMYWRPTERQIEAFLDAALDPDRQPVFVHCQHGEDRTGSLVAIYRIVKQGWDPQRAYDEALTLGMAPWNPFMRRLILHEAAGAFRRRPADLTSL
jgi:protein tyrosine phosphatase (PTP) superfamily phosphohydrolase (DUF442 family)